MLIDPSGLAPKWNEADNHWFALRHEVIDGGGTYSWNRFSSTATVSMYGVTVRFQNGTIGVETRTDGVMYVRADVFYSTIVEKAEEMIFLGEHTAMVNIDINPFQHASIIMFVSPNHILYSLDDFESNERWGGVRYATIGGESGVFEHYIRGTVNRPSDRDLSNKNAMQWIHSDGGRNLGKAQSLLDANNYFNTNHQRQLRYHISAVPEVYRYPTMRVVQRYNSNSYARGLLNAIGIFPRPLGNLPGWNYPIASRYFSNRD